MSPQAAADADRAYVMPFAGRGIWLGAPAVSNGVGGLPWLRDLLGRCGDCKIDFVPIYWYASATNIAYFQNYVSDAHDAAGGRNIRITEVRCLEV